MCCVGWQAGDGKPVSDQWLPPFVIVDDDKKPVGTIEDGDAVVISDSHSLVYSAALEQPAIACLHAAVGRRTCQL